MVDTRNPTYIQSVLVGSEANLTRLAIFDEELQPPYRQTAAYVRWRISIGDLE